MIVKIIKLMFPDNKPYLSQENIERVNRNWEMEKKIDQRRQEMAKEGFYRNLGRTYVK